jgi:hypothetical protein
MATTLLHTPSRASTSSGSSFQPVSRQNTMSSQDGNRSMRASKRYSVTALYLSMNANQKDLEIEDDLARGMRSYRQYTDESADYAQHKKHCANSRRRYRHNLRRISFSRRTCDISIHG